MHRANWKARFVRLFGVERSGKSPAPSVSLERLEDRTTPCFVGFGGGASFGHAPTFGNSGAHAPPSGCDASHGGPSFHCVFSHFSCGTSNGSSCGDHSNPPPVATAGISGTVTDTDGNVLAGVTVDLRDGNGHAVASTTTNGAGQFSFTNLPAGSYQLVAEPPSPDFFSSGTVSETLNGVDITGVVLVLPASGAGGS